MCNVCFVCLTGQTHWLSSGQCGCSPLDQLICCFCFVLFSSGFFFCDFLFVLLIGQTADQLGPYFITSVVVVCFWIKCTTFETILINQITSFRPKRKLKCGFCWRFLRVRLSVFIFFSSCRTITLELVINDRMDVGFVSLLSFNRYVFYFIFCG